MQLLGMWSSFHCIPNTHENRARVARPFLPRAGDAIHPALRKREGSGFETRLIPSFRGCMPVSVPGACES